jgi:hypothetical protein
MKKGDSSQPLLATPRASYFLLVNIVPHISEFTYSEKQSTENGYSEDQSVPRSKIRKSVHWDPLPPQTHVYERLSPEPMGEYSSEIRFRWMNRQ